jgi:hypothetical protein
MRYETDDQKRTIQRWARLAILIDYCHAVIPT